MKTIYDLGWAIKQLKAGKTISRSGWHIGFTWLVLVTPTREADSRFDPTPYIAMKTADNKILPWVATQIDLLAEDYRIYA